MFAQLLLVAGCPLMVMLSSVDADADSNEENVAPSVNQDLETVLDEWQRREPTIERALVRFQRYEYDEVFGIEKRSVSVLHFEPREAYSWTIQPSKIAEGTSSTKRTLNGNRFVIEPAARQAFYLDRGTSLLVEHEAARYSAFEIPPQFDDLWSWDILKHNLVPKQDPEQPLAKWQRDLAATLEKRLAPLSIHMLLCAHIDLRASLLTGTNIEQLRETFDWSLGETSRKKFVSLTARPTNATLRRQFERVDVLLDPDSYRTKGIRIVDPAGSRTTVLVPQRIEINDKVEPVRAPNLQGYKLVTSETQRTPELENNAAKEPTWWPILIGIVLVSMGLP